MIRQTDSLGTFRPIVAWAWNDTIKKERLAGQIRSIGDLGFGGFAIMPWWQLPYSFMSDEFLDGVEFALSKAEEKGLEVWLFDDWLFPSGFGGGAVTSDVRYRAKTLKLVVNLLLEPGECFQMALPERFVAASLVAVDKYGNPAGASPKPLMPRRRQIQYRAEQGRERLLIVCWQVQSRDQYTTRSSGAVDDMTQYSVDMLNPSATRRFLELSHEKYYQRLARYFGGTLKGFFYDEPGQSLPFPWTEGFAEEFRAKKGTDLLEKLPLLLCAPDRPESKTLLRDYTDVWTDLCAENFYGEMARWCHEHGVLSVGHQLNDHQYEILASDNGDFFKNIVHSDHPGIDVVWDHVEPGKFVDFPRFGGSAARILGKETALSESLGAMGHGMHADAMRYMLEHQIVRGVTKFYFMLFNYELKRQFYFHPPDLSAKNPVMAAFGRMLTDRTNRLSTLMNTGRPAAEIGVYVPMSDIYTGCGDVCKNVEAIANHLCYTQREIDYLWDQAIRSLPLEDDALVAPAGSRYRKIVIPEGAEIITDVAQRLEAFSCHGGQVLVVGTPPECLASFAHSVEGVDDLDGMLQNEIRVRPGGVPISVSRRVTDEYELLFLLNESNSEQEVILEWRRNGRLLELDLSRERCTLLSEGEVPQTALLFEPTASKLLILNWSDSWHAQPAIEEAGNPVVLDHWEIELPDGSWVTHAMPLPSWSDLGLAVHSGWIRYRTCFEYEADQSNAILDMGTVCYGAEVLMDGKKIGRSAFRPHWLVIRSLKRGRHLLEIRVLNTLANQVAGTPEREAAHRREGVFRGTYSDHYLPMDKQKMRSGLFGPVRIIPILSGMFQSFPNSNSYRECH